MSVLSRPSGRVVSIGLAEDPYKKCWWVVLVGFGLTGAWLCVPLMETPVGSTRVGAAASAVDAGAEQSLDSAHNPAGAPGAAFDLAMDASRRKGLGEEPVGSMLYQAPPEDPGLLHDGAPLGQAAQAGSSAPGNLAQALKDLGKKDQKDSSGGWAGEKAQRGFVSPHIAGGSLSGLKAASGAASSASAGVGVFGSPNAQASFGAARGLRDDGSADGRKGGGGSAGALRQMSNAVNTAAASRSGDKAVSSLSKAFDGAQAQNAIALGGEAGGSYGALDSAPVNLKLNDPKLDGKKYGEPPTHQEKLADDKQQQMMQQMGMMIASAVIGGVVGGAAGQMVMMAGTMLMQQQQAQAAEDRARKQQEQVEKRSGAR